MFAVADWVRFSVMGMGCSYFSQHVWVRLESGVDVLYGTDTPTKFIRFLTGEKLYTGPKAESEGNEIAVRWKIPRPRYVPRNIAE